MRLITVIFLFFLIFFISCASKTNTQFKYSDFGLREFSYNNKVLIVASEHSDNDVALYIGSTLDKYSDLGKYVDIDPKVMDVYKQYDILISRNEEPIVDKHLLENQELLEYTLQSVALAGYELFFHFNKEELQQKYLNAVGPENKKILQSRAQMARSALNTEPKRNSPGFWEIFLTALAQSLGNAGSYNNSYLGGNLSNDNTVYSRDECIGPVIMGKCQGSILPKAGYHEKCYGSWLNGKCTGPQF